MDNVAHTDHPLQHWDRMCPACWDEAKAIKVGALRVIPVKPDHEYAPLPGHASLGIELGVCYVLEADWPALLKRTETPREASMTDKSNIFAKLKAVKTMPELDALRAETVAAMEAAGAGGFAKVQKAFIAAKNRLKRIPLRERTW